MQNGQDGKTPFRRFLKELVRTTPYPFAGRWLDELPIKILSYIGSAGFDDFVLNVAWGITFNKCGPRIRTYPDMKMPTSLWNGNIHLEESCEQFGADIRARGPFESEFIELSFRQPRRNGYRVPPGRTESATGEGARGGPDREFDGGSVRRIEPGFAAGHRSSVQ